MNKKEIYLGETVIGEVPGDIRGKAVEFEGESYYEIAGYDLMPDFFMTIVSDSDHWMFISSNGSLSAGRKDRDNALFPYYTVDKIHDYKGITGSKTLCLIEREGTTRLWEPFVDHYKKIYKVKRRLLKSIYGNKIIFEEYNPVLEASFQYAWCNSEKYGWVRKSRLINTGKSVISYDIIDGISNILPYGADYNFQNEYSNLLDAYKRSELLEDSKLGLFTLSSIPVDRAEPSEALKATTVWSVTPAEEAKYLLSDKQLNKFRTGHELLTEKDIKATRGAYYINCPGKLDAGKTLLWYIIAEVSQDSTEVANLDQSIKEDINLAEQIEEDIRLGTQKLKALVGGADGLQMGRDKLSLARHFSNTLYNSMRGGVFADNYTIDTSDLKIFIQQSNTEVYKSLGQELAQLPGLIDYSDLIRWSSELNKPDLERICYEYLPLTFSRRHGDPSRPWNQFSIEAKNADGSRKLSFEGNWRDIFQNWEALSISFPLYVESVISKFVNASTADGYNPYRISREGIDWECPDPDDSWSYIGYWNDHQLIYLQKFLEQSNKLHPVKLDELLQKEIFVYANVPYRIKSYDELVKNPQDTIVFDYKEDKRIREVVSVLGSDGKLLHDRKGNLYRVNLMEKILATLLSKLSNFIPGAGIWLNTQRPEWNDANNALVGNGSSMVTLYYLRRFLLFWKKKLENSGLNEFSISEELLSLLNKIQSIFDQNKDLVKKGFSDKDRFSFTGMLGRAGSSYRQEVYAASFKGSKKKLAMPELLGFIELALLYVDQTIGLNKRDDGLYHAYKLVSFDKDEISVRNLYEMLEGQVAVLSSGYLDAAEGLAVLDAMKASKLFREDQYSYLLYPDRELPRFTQKNIIPEKDILRSQVLQDLELKGDNTIIRKDNSGTYHFNGSFRNVNDLLAALEELDNNRSSKLTENERELITGIFESVFDHKSFTGRSGTFYGYEGLGSIYWHMVSKLLLATQECYLKGRSEGADPLVLGRLQDHYYEIKAGIGIYKSPALYGAFPTDAYSHTPAGSGAKQPGLTGQVKEDIISRFGEFGVNVSKGMIEFNPALLNPSEVLESAETFTCIDIWGREKKIGLKAGQLAFTYCQVPVIYTMDSKQDIRVEFSDGSNKVIEGSILDKDTSREIFYRTGKVKKIECGFEL